MRRIHAVLLSAALVFLPGATAIFHDVTYTGTVMTVEATKLGVMVTDTTTKAVTHMDFGVTDATKVYRGDQAVTFAQAHVQKDERVAVTINREVAGMNALVIRLAAHD